MGTVVTEKPQPREARPNGPLAPAGVRGQHLVSVNSAPASSNSTASVTTPSTRATSLARQRPSLKGQIEPNRDLAPFPPTSLGPPSSSKTPLFTAVLQQSHQDAQPFDQAFADTLRPSAALPSAAPPEEQVALDKTPKSDPIPGHAEPLLEPEPSQESLPAVKEAQTQPSPTWSAAPRSARSRDVRIASSSGSSVSSPKPQDAHQTPHSLSRARHVSTTSNARSHKAHGRRGSVMSIAGFTDLGSHEPLAAPPAVSAAEAHQWRGASFSSERMRRPSAAGSNIMDAPVGIQSSLPPPLLPTLTSLQSSADMARARSDPGYQIQLTLPPDELPALPPRPPSPRGALSSSGGGLSRTSTRTSTTSAQIHRMSMSEQELEEPDFNPLYLLLSTSSDPDLQSAWHRAGLVIVPPRSRCPLPMEMLDHPEWIKSHVFEPDFSSPQTSGSASHWSSLGATPMHISLDKGKVSVSRPQERRPAQERLPSSVPRSPVLTHRNSRISLADAVPFPSVDRKEDEDEDEILIPYRPPPRHIPIQTETTVYRRKPLKSTSPPPIPSKSAELNASVGPMKSRPKFGGGKIKAPKWLQRASFSRSSISSAAEMARKPALSSEGSTSSEDLVQASPATRLEMLRVVALEEPLIPWPEDEDHYSAAQTPVAEQKSDSPDFDDHLPFAAAPDGKQVPASRNLIQDLAFLDRESGRRPAVEGILQEIFAWCAQFCPNYIYVSGWEPYTCRRIRIGVLDKAWGDLVELYDAETKLFQMIENVVMGIMHEKIYVQSILRHYQSENARLNVTLDDYRPRVTLSDFGAVPADINCDEAVKILSRLSNSHDSQLPSDLLERLEEVCLPVLPDVRYIRNLAKAIPPFDITTLLRQTIDALIQSAQAAGSIHVGTDELLPLVAFVIVKSGVRSPKSLFLYAKNFTQSSLGPEFEWSLATFEAATDYLAEDPLNPQHALKPPSPTVNRRKSPAMQRRHTEDVLLTPNTSQRYRAPPSHLSTCNSFSAGNDPSESKPSLGLKQPSLSVPSLLDLGTSLTSASTSESGMSASPVDTEGPQPPLRPSMSRSNSLPTDQMSRSPPQSACLSFDVDDSQSLSSGQSATSPEPFHRTSTLASSQISSEDSREKMPMAASKPRAPLPTSAAVELRRSRTDSIVKASSDSWSTLFGFSAPPSESVGSPAPESPAHNEEDWYGWTRRRLSSVTSIGSLGSSLSKDPDARGCLDLDRSTLDQVEENSTAVHHRSPPHWDRTHRPRPLSTVSLASISSEESSNSAPHGCLSSSQSSLPRSASATKRVRRGSKLRRDLLVSGGQSALPPQVDFSTVQSLGSSNSHRYALPHSPISPIRESFDTPFAAPPPSSAKASTSPAADVLLV